MSNTAHNSNRKAAQTQFQNASGMARTSPVPSIPAPVPVPISPPVPAATPAPSATASASSTGTPDKVTEKIVASPSFRPKSYHPLPQVRRIPATAAASPTAADARTNGDEDSDEEMRRPRTSPASSHVASASPRRTRRNSRQPGDELTDADDEASYDVRHRRNPFASLAWLFEASGGGVIRATGAGKRYQALTPVERVIFFTGGFLLWCTGAVLTSVFMTMFIPAFREQAKGGIVAPGAVLVGIAASTLFMLVELTLWKGGSSPVMLVFALAFLAIDIAINIVGCMELFGMRKLGADPASVFTIAVGVGVAVMPERFMSLAWRK